MWDLMATLAASGDRQQAITVTPIRVLIWSNTDNYFMNMGYHPGECTSKFTAAGITFQLEFKYFQTYCNIRKLVHLRVNNLSS
jgi:hypothetical protein